MASKQDSTKVMWRLQWREARGRKWKNLGLYETRANARRAQYHVRNCYVGPRAVVPGFGNVRVVRHVRGGGR